MAFTRRELSYGVVQVYNEQTLGIGAYGKVCKAKYGQLPCAAKLLHDTLFHYGDAAGTHELARRFEQECQFLSTIKHPNIVQYLGTSRDSRSQRPVLLMELMDESLTRFLERLTAPLPYHTQLNICHDVALALAYLHLNGIVHRDLSSNNVLLIGEGSRAKVTDFGMSKLIDANPHTTPLSQCPGTAAYMPPEALITPPQYSNKLDCFSHGVLTIQIITRKFPNPGSANTYVEDPKYPGGRVLIQYPEVRRRKNDIDQANPDHPLLPLAHHCLKDRDTERPSAVELCEQISSLKCAPRYRQSAEFLAGQTSSLQQLVGEIEAKEQIIRDVRAELCSIKEEHQRKIKAKESLVQQILEDCQYQTEQKVPPPTKSDSTEHQVMSPAENNTSVSCAPSYSYYYGPGKPQPCPNKSLAYLQHQPQMPQQWNEKSSLQTPANPITLAWSKGEPAPQIMRSIYGAAVVHGNTAYFSASEQDLIFSYTARNNKWSRLPRTKYVCFSLAIVKDQLTIIGGTTDFQNGFMAVSALCSLTDTWTGKKWKESLPPMPTKRICAAAITTPTHLVVTGGALSIYDDKLSVVEVLSLDTLEWFKASSLPQVVRYPQVVLCHNLLCLCDESTVFSCHVDDLIKSCKRPSDVTDIHSVSIWTRLAGVPVNCAPGLATFKGNLLAVGGKGNTEVATGAVHCYNFARNSWSVVSTMPTPRSHVLTAVLPTDQLVVVGGIFGETSVTTEIGELHH